MCIYKILYFLTEIDINENKQKHNGRLNICDHIPKENLFEKNLVLKM